MYSTRIIVFFILCVLTASSFYVEDSRSAVENGLITSVISLFTEHNIMFHYDSFTANKIDSIIMKSNINSSNLMVNYDMNSDETTNGSIIMERPVGHKFLHVILLQNYSRFIEYSTASIYSFIYLDIILNVINLNADNETASTNFDIFIYNIHRAGAYFILDVWNFCLYNVCFYCGNKFGKWQKLADLSDMTADSLVNVKIQIDYVYDRQFKDFNGHIFDVGYSMYVPFFWCYITHDGNETWYSVLGSEGALLYTFHEKFNMRYAMVEISDINNTSAHVIQQIRNHSVDWAVGGITTTIKRLEVVDFTNYINTEPYVVIYSLIDDPWMSWISVISPFHLSVWITLSASICIISCLFYVSMSYTHTGLSMEFKYFIQSCLRFLVEQPLPYIRTSMKSRWTSILLMTLWLLVAMIMTSAYKSKLTSTLINSQAEEYNDADELVKLNYSFYINNEDSSVIREYLENSEDDSFLEILKRSKNDKHFCKSLIETFGQKIAVIDEETNIQFLIQEMCGETLSLEEQEDLRLLTNDLFPTQHAWPMPKNSPYKNSMNLVISRLHAGGLFLKWNNEYASTVHVTKSYQTRSRNFHSCRNKFTLMSLIGPAFIWSFGMIAATISFIVELIRGKK